MYYLFDFFFFFLPSCPLSHSHPHPYKPQPPKEPLGIYLACFGNFFKCFCLLFIFINLSRWQTLKIAQKYMWWKATVFLPISCDSHFKWKISKTQWEKCASKKNHKNQWIALSLSCNSLIRFNISVKIHTSFHKIKNRDA